MPSCATGVPLVTSMVRDVPSAVTFWQVMTGAEYLRVAPSCADFANSEKSAAANSTLTVASDGMIAATALPRPARISPIVTLVVTLPLWNLLEKYTMSPVTLSVQIASEVPLR